MQDVWLEDLVKGEKEKAKAELQKLPDKIRPFYMAQYGLGIGNEAGEFLGLACKICYRWIEFGHDKDCAVKDIT